MRPGSLYTLIFASAGAMALSACGGGGGGISFIPVPPQAPTPTPAPGARTETVTIFPNPRPSTYASVGGASGDLPKTPSARFGSISTADPDQPHIRYTTDGHYEVQLPGSAWDALVPYKGLAQPTTDNTSFQPATAAQNLAYFNTLGARSAGYSYSEYANWLSDSGRFGWVAVGIPTEVSGVPVSGSATFNGTVVGTVDIMTTDELSAPAYYPSGVGGTVTLNFDFLHAKLAGAMDLSLRTWGDPVKIGSYSFADTVYSASSTTYSGRFDTNVAGANFFTGRFTGPHAEETIGAWAIPFVFSQGGGGIAADSQVHQAFGAWVAKH